MFHPFFTELDVAEIFSIVAYCDVNGETYCPNCHEDQYYPLANVGVRRIFRVPLDHQTDDWEDKSQTPHHINIAIVLLILAPKEEDELCRKRYHDWHNKVIIVNFSTFCRILILKLTAGLPQKLHIFLRFMKIFD